MINYICNGITSVTEIKMTTILLNKDISLFINKNYTTKKITNSFPDV